MSRRRRALRLLVTIAALSMAAYFVNAAGLEQLMMRASEGSRWLPFLVVFQMGMIAFDVSSLRHLLGARDEAPRRVWLRATALAVACDVFLPAGRAAGEALRAATLSPWFGAKAAESGARQQACSLLATGTASALAALATLRTPLLAAILAGNALLCGLLGGALLAVIQHRRLASWIKPLIVRLFGPEPRATTEPPSLLRAYGFCLGGRLVQVLQYGVALVAVGGTMTPSHAFAASGVHLIGATVGDFLPGQLGATEGAYSVFAGALDLSQVAALSLVLLVRAALVIVSLGSLAATALMGRSHELA